MIGPPDRAHGIIPGPFTRGSMANIKSAKKRMLISAKKHDRNRVVRSAVKTHVTRVRRLVDGGEVSPSAEVTAAVQALDRAAERGILHPNNAARRKSRLMKMVAKASAPPADPQPAPLPPA